MYYKFLRNPNEQYFYIYILSNTLLNVLKFHIVLIFKKLNLIAGNL